MYFIFLYIYNTRAKTLYFIFIYIYNTKAKYKKQMKTTYTKFKQKSRKVYSRASRITFVTKKKGHQLNSTQKKKTYGGKPGEKNNTVKKNAKDTEKLLKNVFNAHTTCTIKDLKQIAEPQISKEFIPTIKNLETEFENINGGNDETLNNFKKNLRELGNPENQGNNFFIDKLSKFAKCGDKTGLVFKSRKNKDIDILECNIAYQYGKYSRLNPFAKPSENIVSEKVKMWQKVLPSTTDRPEFVPSSLFIFPKTITTDIDPAKPEWNTVWFLMIIRHDTPMFRTKTGAFKYRRRNYTLQKLTENFDIKSNKDVIIAKFGEAPSTEDDLAVINIMEKEDAGGTKETPTFIQVNMRGFAVGSDSDDDKNSALFTLRIKNEDAYRKLERLYQLATKKNVLVVDAHKRKITDFFKCFYLKRDLITIFIIFLKLVVMSMSVRTTALKKSSFDEEKTLSVTLLEKIGSFKSHRNLITSHIERQKKIKQLMHKLHVPADRKKQENDLSDTSIRIESLISADMRGLQKNMDQFMNSFIQTLNDSDPVKKWINLKSQVEEFTKKKKKKKNNKKEKKKKKKKKKKKEKKKKNRFNIKNTLQHSTTHGTRDRLGAVPVGTRYT